MINDIAVAPFLPKGDGPYWHINLTGVSSYEDLLMRITEGLDLPEHVISQAMGTISGIGSLNAHLNYDDLLKGIWESTSPIKVANAAGQNISLASLQKLAHHMRAACPLSATLVVEGLPDLMRHEHMLAEQFVVAVLCVLRRIVGVNMIVVIPGFAGRVTRTDSQGLFAACLQQAGEPTDQYRSLGWECKIGEGGVEYIQAQPRVPIEVGGGLYRLFSICHLVASPSNSALRFLMSASCFYDVMRGIAVLLEGGDVDSAIYHAKGVREYVNFKVAPDFCRFTASGVLNDEGEPLSIEVAYDGNHKDEFVMFTHPSSQYGGLSRTGARETLHNAMTAIVSVGLMEGVYLLTEGDQAGAREAFNEVLGADLSGLKAALPLAG